MTTTSTAATTRTAQTKRAAIPELVDQLEHANASVSIDVMREQSRELVREVIAFHGEGLRRMIDLVGAANPSLLQTMTADPLIASLFDLHEIDVSIGSASTTTGGVDVPVGNLVRKKATSTAACAEDEIVCELCGVKSVVHAHVVEVATSTLRCACRACALLFSEVTPGQRYRQVPRDVHAASSSIVETDSWWRSIGLPVGVAFFVRREVGGGATARYPGPSGVTESPIDAPTWDAIASQHDCLRDLIPEVQALVVNRSNGARDHFVVGVDRCYELALRIRKSWHGFTGGDGARSEVRAFFEELAKETR